MQIDSHSRKVSELFPIEESADAFNIPEYQRRYSWREEQIEQLFNDIMEEDPGYYIGNLLVTHSNPGNDNVFDVIDGQQRLTTISLLLLALWDKFGDFHLAQQPTQKAVHDNDDTEERQDESLPPISEEDYGRCYSNRIDIKRRLLGKSKPQDASTSRIIPLEEDRIYYRGLLSRLTDSPVEVKGNRVFVKRYRYIRTLLNGENFNTVSKVDEFYNKLLSTVILQVTVSNLSDAFSVFSSLNAKGLPLTLVDLLKGQFIGAAARRGIDRNDTLEDWTDFVGMFSPAGEDANVSAVTQFLLNNFDVFESVSAKSITKGKAIRLYENLIQDKYRGGDNYLETLLHRADLFATITRIPGHEYGVQAIDRKLDALNRLDSTQAIPLLLALFDGRADFAIDDNQLGEILDILIRFYVRRNITLVPKSSNTRSRMLELVRKIRKPDGPRGDAAVSLIAAALKEISSPDSIFLQTLETEGLYDKNAKTARYVLIALERGLEGSSPFDKGHPDNLDDDGKNGKPIWTIEHILPEGESLPAYWQRAISPDTPDKAKEVQDQYVHLLGNLTLTPYNSDLKQRPFVNADKPYADGMTSYRESKRDFCDNGHFVGMRNPIRLNASIPDTANGENIESKTDWTIADITRRTKYLAEELVRLFAFPSRK